MQYSNIEFIDLTYLSI